MAEDDWYFGFNRYHYIGGVMIVAALLFLVTGVLGYNTSRVSSGVRWMGAVEWDQVVIGLVALGLAVVNLRRARHQ